jgi:pimeloyl-ACP methyl ester carboxylesterase
MWSTTGWDMIRSGPADAERTVLLLPGGWCTAAFYQELMAEPVLAGIRLFAVTLPGNGGTSAPDDVSIENYARLTAELAADLGTDVVLGHSMGANVALEMAASGAFTGPLVLLAPSFSSQDEAMIIRVLDRLARLLGAVPFAAMRMMMRFAVKDSPLPPERLAVLVTELRKNDPRFMRRGIHRYLQYLEQHGSVASRLCASGVPAWVVHGESGDGGVTDEERRTLQAYSWIRIVTIPGRSFFTPNEESALVAGLVAEALEASTPVTT